jgi:N-acetylglucosaminyldiphosphoundecaprenol N-acetyl-beta-D-mannosaminyltransferase
MNLTLPEPPMVVLLGLPFHDATLEETLTYCHAAMLGNEPRYLVTANMDFAAQAYEDPDLKKIVFFADRIVCDGMPLIWLSKFFGYALRERVAGSDMVPRLLEICGKDRLPVYFFGTDLDTLAEAKVTVEHHYPGLKVVGIDSPPFGAVIEWDNDALCAKMKASGAKLLLVCLGCPKQERWIFAHHRECGIPLSIGVGASLDFITGKQKRAPVWMQKSGLEWFWRMSGNPSRLVSRYAKDLVFLIVGSWRQHRFYLNRSSFTQPLNQQASLVEEPSIPMVRIRWVGELQLKNMSRAPLPEVIKTPVILHASAVSFIDNSGLGHFTKLVRRCRAAGQLLFVVNPSHLFKSAIHAVRMESLYQTVETEDEALGLIEKYHTHSSAEKVLDDGVVWVSFDCSLDALYYNEMILILESAITSHDNISALIVDLRNVSFIDSRAVGGLIRAWKQVAAGDGKMFLAGASTGVREIINLLRLDKILPEWEGDFPT